MASERTVRSALQIVAEKVPELALRAMRAQSYRSEQFLPRARTIIEEAIGKEGFSPADRQLLTNVLAETSDGQFTFLLRVQLTAAQEERLKADAQSRGLDVSAYVRTRLFGSDRGVEG